MPLGQRLQVELRVGHRVVLARCATLQGGLGERLQAGGGDRGAKPFKRTLHQAQVQRAHDVLMALGHLTERALAQAQPVPRALGLRLRREPQHVEHAGELLDGLLGTRPLTCAWWQGFGQRSARCSAAASSIP
jgi:hypothetical protein